MWLYLLLGAILWLVILAFVAIIVLGEAVSTTTGRILIVISGIPLVVVLGWSAIFGRYGRRRRFAKLVDLNDDDLYALFYGNSGYPKSLVCGLREDVARAFSLPSHKLHPEHRFDRDLYSTGVSLTDEVGQCLADAIDSSIGRVGGRPQSVAVESLGAYIGSFCRWYVEQQGLSRGS